MSQQINVGYDNNGAIVEAVPQQYKLRTFSNVPYSDELRIADQAPGGATQWNYWITRPTTGDTEFFGFTILYSSTTVQGVVRLFARIQLTQAFGVPYSQTFANNNLQIDDPAAFFITPPVSDGRVFSISVTLNFRGSITIRAGYVSNIVGYRQHQFQLMNPTDFPVFLVRGETLDASDQQNITRRRIPLPQSSV